MNIFVAKLSRSTSSEDLKDLFGEFGEVSSANVIMDKATGNSKCFGFVEMPNDAEAEAAIKELDECEYDDSVIVVKKARPKEEGGSRGGFGGGNRGGFGGGNRGGGRDRNYSSR